MLLRCASRNVSNLCPPSLSRERGYFERHFHPVLGEKDGHGLFDWKGFHQEIHSNPDSTDKDKKFTTLEAALYGVHDHVVFGEWHHLLPLCFNGATDYDANYSRLRPLMHVKTHAALCYFFPSSFELQTALIAVASPNCNNTRPAEDVSAVELLDDEDLLEQIAEARE